MESVVSDVMSPHIPLGLIRYQTPMIRAWSRVYAKAVLPFGRNARNPERFKTRRTMVAAPAEALVQAYADWCGPGVAQRYRHSLPPHMFCQWGLSLAIEVIEQSRYNVADIINQGVSMRTFGELPRGEALRVAARLTHMEEIDGRANLSISIITGTKARPRLVEAVLHTTFLLPGNRRPGVVKPFRAGSGAQWTRVGQWQALVDDGLRFALLTGDFNPIHWVDSVGRKSPFGQTVLQGLGMFARSYEQLVTALPIREIDVRFQRPVLLPSGDLSVEYSSPEEGWHTLRLNDENARVRMSGRCR